MLDVQNLTTKFGAVTAVDGVSFSVKEPTMIGVLGLSGSGKSTLLRTLNRLTDATSGEVHFENRDVLKLRGKSQRQWRSDCAMIFQQFNLVPRLDVISNVLLGTLARRSTLASVLYMYPQKDVQDASEIMERFGILNQAEKRAEALSGGQQQRVAIARALMQHPKIILADEPVSSLDPTNTQIVMETLRQIHEEDDRIVIVNLHSLEIAEKYCDRIIGLNNGRIVFSGKPDHLTDEIKHSIYDQHLGHSQNESPSVRGQTAIDPVSIHQS